MYTSHTKSPKDELQGEGREHLPQPGAGAREQAARQGQVLCSPQRAGRQWSQAQPDESFAGRQMPD